MYVLMRKALGFAPKTVLLRRPLGFVTCPSPSSISTVPYVAAYCFGTVARAARANARPSPAAWGWNLAEIRTRSCQRVDVQLLLVALATTVALLAGIAAEQAHLARHYQANTERRRRVLSLVALGRRMLATRTLLLEQLTAALEWLHDHIPQISWLYALT
jgi:hypothetical protein